MIESLSRAISSVFLVIASPAIAINLAQEKQVSAWAPTRAQVHELEAKVVLPSETRKPLAAYDRYYTGLRNDRTGQRVIKGTLLAFGSKPRHGTITIDSPGKMPKVGDFGCDVVYVVYDPSEKRFMDISCSGQLVVPR